MDQYIYWVWLSLAVTPGSDTFAKLLSESQDPYHIYKFDADTLRSLIGARSKDFSALLDKNLDKAEEVLSFCNKKNIGLLVYDDPLYPRSLKYIKNPPVMLYYRGKLPDFNKNFCVSVVGTRWLSAYGRKNSFAISYDLARAGAIIVSGMALGIDGVAHAGAIAAGAPTVALLGSGIDVCYPSQHKKLAREIVKNGAVLTEYPLGTPPEKYNFPIRNRLISGLSGVTFVVEGKERSGAMSTARHAKEQERALYALPGNVGNINSQLTNLLIKNGARLCTCADDIVRDFETSSLGRLNPFELAKPSSVDMFSVLSELEVSAVSAEDSIFKPSSKRKKKDELPNTVSEPDVAHSDEVSAPAFDMSKLEGFDALTVRIYQKIPSEGECKIESLVEDDLSMRIIMKGLLKLEMGRFVTLLPGERVRRNFFS